jgi:hypothetical protein
MDVVIARTVRTPDAPPRPGPDDAAREDWQECPRCGHETFVDPDDGICLPCLCDIVEQRIGG